MWIEGAAYIDLGDLSVTPPDLELSDLITTPDTARPRWKR